MSRLLTCRCGRRWRSDSADDAGRASCPNCGATVHAPPTDEAEVTPGTAHDSAIPSLAATLPLTPANVQSPVIPPAWEHRAPPGYEVLGELGRGGMGVVYKARQLGLGRLVALKMILHAGHAGEEQRQRFTAEARVIARLQHPNVVQIHDVGEHEGLPFFSFEFCSGGSLANRLTGTPQSANKAAELVEVLARAVQTAHQAGVVHRDLKPANVLLAEDGTPKITDFGLAKKLDEVGETATGSILGTPSYMSPEQAAGQTHAIGPPADVYSLGAILYECLTGRPPFKGPTLLDTLEQVRSQEPVAPRRLQPTVPRDLETICLKCLHKEPDRRYGSARELAEDCGRFLRGEPIRARPVARYERTWRWCRRQPALAALAGLSALTLALLLAVGFWYSARLGAAQGETEAASERAVVAEKEVRTARELAGTREYFGLLSRVRERAARRPTGWTGASAEDLVRAATLPPAAAALPELRTELADCLSSIDVREIGHAGKGCVAFRLAFDPRGRWLALGERKAQAWAACSVLLADPRTGRTVHRLSYSPSLSFQFDKKVQDGGTALAFSADGRWLVLGTRSGMLHRWDLNQQPPHREKSWSIHQGEISRLYFSPDDKTLFSLSEDRTLRSWDVAGGWRKIAEFTRRTKTGELAVCPRGTWLVCSDDERLHVLRPDTLTPAHDAIPLDGANRLSACPDGRTIAVEARQLIRIVDVVAGRIVRTLRAPGSETSHESAITCLVFSPDGALLASSSEPTGEVRLWDLAGGRLLTSWVVGSGTVHMDFQPDGRILAVLAEDRTRLYEISGRDIQTVSPLHSGPVRAFALHPGGGVLACLAETVLQQMPAWELSGWRFSGDAPRPVFRRWIQREAARGLTFDPEGRSLIYSERNDVYRWDWMTGAGDIVKLGSSPDRLQFARGGRLWADHDGELRAWDLPRTQPVARWNNALSDALSGLGGIRGLAAGRRRVIVAGRDGNARLLRAGDASMEAAWTCARCPLTAAALSPSEMLCAVGTEQGEIVLLAVPTGEVLARWTTHTDAVTSLAFAGDGLLASGSRDQKVQLTAWDGRAAHDLFALRLAGPVVQVAFAADGRRLAVLVQGERAARLCDLGRLWPRLDALSSTDSLPPLPETAQPSVLSLPPLSIEESARCPHGLRAELFDGPNFERKVVTRYDLSPNADWGAGAPDPRLPADCFSIRWTGWLKVPRSGRYVLRLRADDGARLWLDGKPILDGWSASRVAVFQVASVDLTAGPHEMRIDYFEAWGGANISFLWTTPGGSPQPVPTEVLFHNRTNAEK